MRGTTSIMSQVTVSRGGIEVRQITRRAMTEVEIRGEMKGIKDSGKPLLRLVYNANHTPTSLTKQNSPWSNDGNDPIVITAGIETLMSSLF